MSADRKSRTFDVVVAGATGAVGEVLLELLHEREFPVGRIAALAGARSAGGRVAFGDKRLPVRTLDGFDFSGWDLALFSAGSDVSRTHAPRAAAAGCLVIDNTSCFRMDPAVPLVVPEINAHTIAGLLGDAAAGGIIANPNCSTIQMVLALAPIHAAAGIARINVATYQSVSGAGRAAVEELATQTRDRFAFQESSPRVLSAPIAFNVLARIDRTGDNGYTGEEMKMHNETRRILNDQRLAVNATAVRVPVFHGHAEAVHLETREEISLERVRELLAAAPGVTLLDANADATPVTHAAGTDEVYVGRLRRDHSHPRGIDLWIVADNLRKGAALNAVQIAEYVTQSPDFALGAR